MANGTCAVPGCDEPALNRCASGRCFCAVHAACSECNVLLSNGEVQVALAKMGGMSEEQARKYLDAKKWDPHATMETETAIEIALRAMSVHGLRLRHSSGDLCRHLSSSFKAMGTAHHPENRPPILPS